MRGLTAAERAMLLEPETPAGPVVTEEDERLFRLMIVQGRIAYRVDGDWEYYGNTDLGNLALRVCPVDE